jgi:ATP-binding cassette subfamily B protein
MMSGLRFALMLAGRTTPLLLLGYVATSVAAGIVPVQLAWLTKLVIDQIVVAGAANLLPLVAALAAGGVLAAVLPHAARYLTTELGRRVSLVTRDRLYVAAERMGGLRELEQPEFRDRLRLAQQHSQSGPVMIISGALDSVRSALTISGFLVALLALSPVMAGIVVLAAVPALIVQIQLSRRRAETMRRTSPAERREFFYADLLTSLDAAKEVRLLGLGPLLRRRMVDEISAINDERRKVDRREVGVQAALALMSAIIAGGGLFWAALAAGHGQLTVGDVSVFVAATAGVQAALGALVGQLAIVHHALTLFQHYQNVLATPPDLPVRDSPAPMHELRKGIELRDVWFRYSDDQPWVLRGVNLFLPHGQAVALVGHNGAGKSTLVKLLCRFYDPVIGSILWDGVDIRDLPLTQMRSRIGAVFQDFMRYDMTAAENIGLGDTDGASELDVDEPGRRERIEAAAQRAGVHDAVSKLHAGYRTMLSRMFHGPSTEDSTGVLLSGGQWQRIALARAFLRDNRDLLILDEPTSGLDPDAEHEIHRRITDHRAGRTSLLISHRLAAVRAADTILVISDGEISEQGSHDELLAAEGTYARLFRLQAKGYAETSP